MTSFNVADSAVAPYSPPKVTVVYPTVTALGDLSYEEQQRSPLVFVLDLYDGRLTAERWRGPSPFHTPGDESHYFADRDLYFHHWGWERRPRQLGFEVVQRTTAYTNDDPQHLARVMDLMGQWAQTLVDSLAPLPTGGYDWSLTASAALERIIFIADYGGQTLGVATHPRYGDGTAPLPPRHHYGAVSFEEVLEASGPGWANPEWAAMSDTELGAEAERILHRYTAIDEATKNKLRATIEFSDRYNARSLAEANQGVPIYPLGVHIGLLRWRDQAVAARAGMPTQHATTYLAEHPDALPEQFSAGTTDRELTRLADLMDAEAATHGVALVAADGVLRNRRAALRDIARRELERAGEHHNAIAAELAQLATRRTSLLLLVASFQEEPEFDTQQRERRYAELARLASMSRQAVRERLREVTADTSRQLPDEVRRFLEVDFGSTPASQHEDVGRRPIAERLQEVMDRDGVDEREAAHRLLEEAGLPRKVRSEP